MFGGLEPDKQTYFLSFSVPSENEICWNIKPVIDLGEIACRGKGAEQLLPTNPEIGVRNQMMLI
jgi:hypothetical protein